MTKAKSDTFAARLGAYRAAAGWSVYRLAQESGVTQQYLAELERGEKRPSLEVARKIAAAFGKTLSCWD